VRKIATNKDADHKKVYKMSLDGKAVEAFIKDVYDGLVARAPNRSRRLRDRDDERAEDETQRERLPPG